MSRNPRTLERCDALSAAHPSIDLGNGYRLHAYPEDGEWHVWLNTEAGDFDGLVIGIGPNKRAALTDAVATLEQITDAIQNGAVSLEE